MWEFHTNKAECVYRCKKDWFYWVETKPNFLPEMFTQKASTHLTILLSGIRVTTKRASVHMCVCVIKSVCES